MRCSSWFLVVVLSLTAAVTFGLEEDMRNPFAGVEVTPLAIDGHDLHSGIAQVPQAAMPLRTELNIREVGSTLWSGINAMVSDGNYLYVAMLRGLIVLDVSTPSAPVLVAQFPLPGLGGRRMAKTGNLVFVSQSIENKLYIVDVTNPAAPVLVTSFGTGLVSTITASGSYVYLAVDSWRDMVEIIDIRNPSTPTLVWRGQPFDSSPVNLLQVSGSTLWVGNNEVLVTYDVSNAQSPVQIGSMPLSGSTRSIIVSGNYLFTSGTPTRAINVASPASPILVLSLPGGDGGLAASGNLMYMADGGSGISIVDISNSNLPITVGGYDAKNRIIGMAAKGSFAYLVFDDEIRILRVSDPSSPIAEGSWPIVHWSTGVATQGNYAYVSSDGKRYGIVDCSNPAEPRMVGSGVWDWQQEGIAVDGNYIYLVGLRGLMVVDVTNPASPVAVDSIYMPMTSQAQDVVVSGRYAYIANGRFGLQIVDISDPMDLQFVQDFDIESDIYGVAVSGNMAFVAGAFPWRMYVIDVSDPSLPILMGSCAAGGTNIEVVGNFAYVAGGMEGLIITDISIPSNPVIVGKYDTYGYVEKVAVKGNYAYVAMRWDGYYETPDLEIVNIENPRSPKLAGQSNDGLLCRSVAFVGDNILVANLYSLQVLRVDPCCAGSTGNVDGDPGDQVDISDLTVLIDNLFISFAPLACDPEANVDGDQLGGVDISDLTALIDHLYISMAALPACQ